MKRVVPVILILLLAGALAYGIFYFYPRWFPDTQSQAFQRQLEQVDQVLALANHQQAQNLLQRLFPETRSVNQKLSVLKRQIRLSQATGNFGPLLAFSQAALLETPGNPYLLTLQLYGFLRSKDDHTTDLDRSAAQLEAILAQSPPRDADKTLFADLKKETGLYKLSRKWGGAENWSNPDYLLERYQIYPEASLLNDAALLWLRSGQYQRAGELFSAPSFLDNATSDEIQALLYYDQADYTRSLYYLTRINNRENTLPSADFLGLEASVLLISHRWDEAELLLRQMAKDVPAISQAARANLALLALSRGEVDQAQASLADLATPDFQLGLLKTEVDFLAGRDRPDSLVNLRSGLLKSPFPEAEVLRMRLFPDTFSLPRLWVLFNREKTNPVVAEYLTYAEIVAENYAKAQSVLAAYRARRGDETWWPDYYEALIAAAQRNWDVAVKAFNRVPEKWRTAEFYYNWGLVTAMDLSRPEARTDALTQFSRSLEALPATDGPELRHRRSLIHTQKGWLHLLQGNKKLARADLTKAADLDDENLKARLLLKKAEE